MLQPKIDIRVAYEPGGKLGEDCNRILIESTHDWVLIFDHDVFLKTHPNWYYIAQQAILKYPDAGLFTARCNNIWNRYQKDKAAPSGHNLNEHIEYAKKRYERFGLKGTPIKNYLSGFWFLMNREKALKVGGFPGKGIFEEDNFFSKRMHKHYPVLLLEGLYFYHERDRVHGSFIEEDKTACEFAKKGKK